ncbi:MAG: hypothetical protein ACI8U0_002696 [Flavobacteriales bacterium]|jgi:hypothetical protein
MEKDIKDIMPGEGLGVIKFGMTQEAVSAILGPPTEKEVITDSEFPDENSEAWHYDELEVSLGFEDMEGWKLMNIALSSAEFTLHNRKLIGLEREKLMSVLDNLGLTEFLLEEAEVDGEQQSLIRSNETGINFFLDNGTLSEVMWSPIIDEEENFIFPN